MNHFYVNPDRMKMFLPAAAAAAQQTAAPAKMESWQEQLRESGVSPLTYALTRGGTAILHVAGAIVSAQIPYWCFYGDITYEQITATLREACDDPDVKNIVIRFNSPGGTVTGCGEAAALIAKMAEEKPIISHCQMADSAAYWMASATGSILIDPDSGEVGSIGVICTHYDFSGMMEKYGVKVTHVFSGDHKADGSPYAPLSDESRARIQEEMDWLRGRFVSAVATYRSLKPADVAATEALTYCGQSALDAGLADGIMFYHEMLERLESASPAPSTAS